MGHKYIYFAFYKKYTVVLREKNGSCLTVIRQLWYVILFLMNWEISHPLLLEAIIIWSIMSFLLAIEVAC
jgi:hypothetical protein